MNIVEKNQKVTISYTLKESNGALIEEATLSNPLTYLHGYHYIIPGLEEFLTGKEEGESFFDVFIPHEKAFGEYMDDLLITVSRSELSHLEPLELGMEVEMYQEHDSHDIDEQEQYLSPDMFRTPATPEDLFGDDDEHDLNDDEDDDDDIDEPTFFFIKEMREHEIVLDGNHKLAGKDILFDISILSVETASFEEIEKEYLEIDDESDNDILGLY